MTTATGDAAWPSALSLERVSYAYADKSVLRDVDFCVGRGDIVALLGPSGCGKTTLLNLAAGLLRPTSGRVRVNGQTAADAEKGVFLPPERRGLGMVFQDYALWPHMTVGRNVAFPLEMRGVPRAQRRVRVAQALARVGLSDFEHRMPSQLSGGQQQRAAVARAVVAEPAVVLFDEPLSNLDRELREGLALDLAALIRKLGLTAVYVTHDQAEAFVLADRIALMRGGRIVQDASPEDLVNAPADAEIAAFLDLGVLARADRLDDGWRLHGTNFRLGGQSACNGATSAQILIPHRAAWLSAPEEAALTGTVVRTAFRPDGYLSTVRLDSQGPEVTVAAPTGKRPKIGERVGVALDSAALRWFPHPVSS